MNIKFRWLTWSGGEMHHHSKFRQNTSIHCRVNVIYRFFKMAAAAILDFINSQILLVEGSRRLICINMSNFVRIDQTVFEIWRFFYFSRWRPPPSWISEIVKFYYFGSPECPCTCITVPNFVKIRQSVAELLRFFRHLGFVWTYLDHSRRVLGGLYYCTKFGCDRCSSFENMKFEFITLWLEDADSPTTDDGCLFMALGNDKRAVLKFFINFISLKFEEKSQREIPLFLEIRDHSVG